MKEIISIIIGIAIFIGGFYLSAEIIDSLTSGLVGDNLRIIMKIVLWIVGFSLITTISIILGTIIGGLVYLILPNAKKKRRF